MKKVLYTIIIMLTFILSIEKVNATVIKNEDVAVDSYIIGEHLLRHRNYIESKNYKGQLTTKLIMYASTTIFSDDIDDMIIYYKNPLGNWTDGETGEAIEVPETFNIEYVDLNRYAPTLMVCKKDVDGSSCLGYDTFIYNVDDYTEVTNGKTIYYLEGYIFDFSGTEYHYEIAEKVGNTYNVLELDEDGYARVELSSGERKIFVARYYTLDENNEPVYSEYSNEAELVGLDVETYKVTFNFNDGESESQEQTVIKGNKVLRPLDPMRDGYSFVEWRLDGVAYDFDTEVTSNIELTAEWNINQYTVTFNTDGGTEIPSQTVNYGEKAIVPSIPVKEGYLFDSWQLVLDNGFQTYDFNTPVIGNITLKASYLEAFVVTFDAKGGSAVDNQIIAGGGTATEPLPPTKEGYTFIEWMYDGKKYDFSTAIWQNKTVEAFWEKNDPIIYSGIYVNSNSIFDIKLYNISNNTVSVNMPGVFEGPVRIIDDKLTFNNVYEEDDGGCSDCSYVISKDGDNIILQISGEDNSYVSGLYSKSSNYSMNDYYNDNFGDSSYLEDGNFNKVYTLDKNDTTIKLYIIKKDENRVYILLKDKDGNITGTYYNISDNTIVPNDSPYSNIYTLSDNNMKCTISNNYYTDLWYLGTYVFEDNLTVEKIVNDLAPSWRPF